MRFPEFNDEWQRTTLGEVSKVSTGVMNTQDKFEDGQYPFYVRSSTIERANRYTYDGIAILTPGDGAIGQIFHYSEGKIAVHQRVYMLTEMQCIPKYLFHYFSARFFERVNRMSAKNTVDSVRMNMITDMPVALPSREEEQEKIASFLSLLDERIEAQRQTIKERKKQKKALLHQLFSQSLRFPGFSDEWQQIPNKQLFAIANKRNTDFQRDQVLSASQSLGMTCREKIGIDIKYKEESISTYKLVNKGDYIIHLRSFQGGFAFSDIDGVCSPAYTILRPIGGLYYGFLKEYFRSTSFINSLVLVTYGIRDGRSISVEEWMLGNTMLPSQAEQKKIAELFTTFDERIEVEEALLACYETQKRYLLQQMFV